MKQRTISLALAALLLGAAMISCSDAAEQTQQQTNAPQSEAVVTEAPSIYDNLPKEDFGGYEFRVLNNTSNFA